MRLEPISYDYYVLKFGFLEQNRRTALGSDAFRHFCNDVGSSDTQLQRFRYENTGVRGLLRKLEWSLRCANGR